MPGTTFEPFRAAHTALLPAIRYEGIVAGFVRELWHRAGPAEALLNLTNDAWLGDSHEARMHLALASFRSLETRRALIRSTSTGIRALVDPAGRIYARTGQWPSGTLVGEIPLIRSGTSPPCQAIGVDDVLDRSRRATPLPLEPETRPRGELPGASVTSGGDEDALLTS